MTQQEKQEIDKKCDEFCEYRRTHSNGYAPREWFMAGAKALDELRKPSERPNLKDFFPTDAQISDVHDEITAAPRLYTYMNALDAYIDNLEAKPSEPETNVCEAGEELVPEIDSALLQPDKELLEALKKICRVAPSYIKNPDDELDNAICEAMLAVYNHEKQSK